MSELDLKKKPFGTVTIDDLVAVYGKEKVLALQADMQADNAKVSRILENDIKILKERIASRSKILSDAN